MTDSNFLLTTANIEKSYGPVVALQSVDLQVRRGEIHALLGANGAAILLYTSELAEIPLVCDRVIVMHGGRIVDEQDAAQATESSMLTAAHGLEVPA